MRIRFVSRLLAVLSFFAAAGAADAQSGTITGRVTQTDGGAPIEAAEVLVVSGSSTVAAVRTGADGNYRVAAPAGTYAVVARQGGFQAKRTEGVVVIAGQTTTLNIAMAQMISRLDAVVTSGTRGAEPEKILDSPNSISLVTSERIAERAGSIGVTDHIKATPGISISNGGIVQANIVSRGFNNAFSTSMLMLQDYRFAGVPSLRVNVPFLFTGTGEDIDRIEVLQGPASALYGPNSGAGVLHVITKSPFDTETQGTSVTLDGGERSMFRIAGRHAQQIGDNFAFKVSGEYFKASDFEYNDPNELGCATGPGTYSGNYCATDARLPASRQNQPVARDFGLERYSGEARLDWRPSANTEAITTFGYTMAGSALEITTTFGAAQVKNWSYNNFQQRFRHKNFFAQVFYNKSNSGNDDALDDNGTFYLRSGLPVVDQSSVLVGQLQQGMTLGNTKLTGGFDYIATTPETKGTIMGRNEDDDNITEMGGYLQFTTPLTDRLDLMGAVRGDMNSRIEGAQFSPRAAFIYKLSATQNFRFTFNRAFNSPASFSMFLDQWSGSSANLGPAINSAASNNLTEIRIFGNPAKEGWQYSRNCASGQADAGGLCMQSNFTGNTRSPVGGASMFPATMNAGLSAQLVGGIAGTFGLTPAQQTNIRNVLNALAPTNVQVSMLLRNVLAGNAVTPFSTVQDFAPLGANFSNTWEVGYKGVIGDKLSVAVDYWYQIRPADPTTQVINGDDVVFFNPATLGAYLGAPGTGVTAALGANGVPAPAIGTVITNWVTSLAGLPTGTLAYDNDLYDRSYLVVSYQNAEGQVDVRGIDVAVDYQLTPLWSVASTYSTLSRNVFTDAAGATPTNPLVANTPRHRASLTVRRASANRNTSFEVRGRYADAFDVNSGVFNSYNQSVPAGGTPYTRVPVNAFMDAGFSWKLPVAQNVRWSVNAQNLLNNEVPSFIGVANVGRFVTTRVSYSF